MTEQTTHTDTRAAMQAYGLRARAAARQMRNASGRSKAAAMLAMAELIGARSDRLKRENARDLEEGRRIGLADAVLDRLTLSGKELSGMVNGLRQIAAMDDAVGSLGPTSARPNGMRVAQMRVPLGVIGVIYESRPNVTIDAAALCLK